MAETPPTSIVVPHVRHAAFSEFRVDGILHRLDGDDVVLTFFQNEVVVTEEHMQIAGENPAGPTYLTSGFTEISQRLDLAAVRVSVSALLATAEHLSGIVKRTTET